MTNPDCRAELQRLVEAYEEHGGKWPDHHEQALFQAVEDARAVLAQPEPEGVVTPTLPGGVPLTGGLSWLIPTLDDVVELCEEFGFELHEDNESGEILWEMFRAVLARWGTPTAQPEPEPVAPTDEELLLLACMTDLVYDNGYGAFPSSFSLEGADATREALSFARAVLARCGQP